MWLPVIRSSSTEKQIRWWHLCWHVPPSKSWVFFWTPFFPRIDQSEILETKDRAVVFAAGAHFGRMGTVNSPTSAPHGSNFMTYCWSIENCCFTHPRATISGQGDHKPGLKSVELCTLAASVYVQDRKFHGVVQKMHGQRGLPQGLSQIWVTCRSSIAEFGATSIKYASRNCMLHVVICCLVLVHSVNYIRNIFQIKIYM